MKGRKRTSLAVKRLRGDPGKRGTTDLTPKPKRAVPSRPPDLNNLSEKYWDYYSEVLDDMGVLTIADLSLLKNFSNICARIDKLTKDVDSEGETVLHQKVDSLGNEFMEVRPNPKISLLLKLYAESRYYSGLFGLNPLDRGKLTVSQDNRSKLTKFLE